ncbi:type VII secretion protein EssC [Salicibibacter cibarius]|uniref:Type VII secretion protein EssC n=1 Tax=Salicibibacter cibarius TaxID=2743000 RepID=A0A7T7CD40_9BACI|nr:type VII secretion protein EssC [Salicibibacter cibarius]QQK77598.1 type VII secretion protein EssC [Salicibibacter cibarius]
MNLLWVFYHTHVQKIEVTEFNAAIGNARDMDLLVPMLGKTVLYTKMDDDKRQCLLMDGHGFQTALTANEPFEYNSEQGTVTFVFTDRPSEKRTYYIGNEKTVSISGKKEADIVIEEDDEHPVPMITLLHKDGQWDVYPHNGGNIYLNGEQLTQKQPIKNGDALLLSFLAVNVSEGDLLTVESFRPFHTELPRMMAPTSEMKKKYPEYRRTPRIIYEQPKDKVKLSVPSQEVDHNQRALWLIILPPLAMLMVMGIVALLIPRGIFIIISVTMFTMTLITSTVTYFREKKARKRKEEKRHRVYTRYLTEKREELQKLVDKQKEVLFYHFPSFERTKYMASHISGRIYEKTSQDDDFMHVRVGRADIPVSFSFSDESSDNANRDKDDLMEQSEELRDAYSEVHRAPLSLSLAGGSIGYVGKMGTVQREVAQMVGQLAFFQSYHELRFVAVFSEEEYSSWEWMRWLPHFQLPHMFAKGLIYNEKTRDQLLTSIYELIRERELDQDGKKRFMPHFVFMVADRALISDHAIMEYLEGPEKALGMSVLFMTDTEENLSEHVHTIIKAVNHKEGEIVIRERQAEHKPFTFDKQDHSTDEDFARLLASLNHQRGMSRSIPDMVSFMELFGVKQTKDLEIDRRWLANDTTETLSVPIGFKGKDELIDLNIHEKAHGPHGLLAGTTGSGKSEFLQTYILSLAVHYHPHEVAFLLIDYKGGGMAQPFKTIPHLLGTITNISESENFSMRALASIKSELKKRQSLFDKNLVNHIDDYMELYNEKKVDEPMPHLFIISDEFAELKNEEPEFIKELVSAARIGRSLGIHLILATQKPGGIIDDQIWSNARFKAALKVQDAQDSKEILKNSDAASLTTTGRGYLQVGNNELYDLFQSAWSGAPYMRETHEGEEEIALVTDAGLVPISNVRTSKAKQEKSKTEIEAVVEEIEAATEQLNIVKAASPWLDPLEEWLPRPEVGNGGEWKFPIAFADEPEKQQQYSVYYEWFKDGNVAVFGSGGFGKSTTLMTMMLTIAEGFSPEELHYYIFDFGTGTLLPFRQLPHTGDYFKIDEVRKIEKLINFLKAEIEKRRELFLVHEVSNIKMFNDTATEPLPMIVLVIDNFDIVKEEFEDVENTVIQFARDGQSLGIYLFLSATRVNAMRQPLVNNMKTKIIHHLLDKNERMSILGRTKFEIEAIPGRVIINKSENYFSQVYLPAGGRDDYEVLEGTKAKIAELKDMHAHADLPDKIAMLPTSLTLSDFKQQADVENGEVPFALDEDKVKPVYTKAAANPHCLVVGQPGKGKSNTLQVLLSYYIQGHVKEIGTFDGVDRKLSHYAREDCVSYIDTKEQINEWLENTSEVMTERERVYMETLDQGDPLPTFDPVILTVDSLSRFQQTIDQQIQGKVVSMMKNYAHLGFRVLIAGNSNEFTKGFDPLTNELKLIRQLILVVKKSDQTLMQLSFSRKEEEITPGFGYYVVNGQDMKIKIPEVL